MTDEQDLKLVKELLALSSESEIVEFKQNMADPDQIGKLVSAALHDHAEGYVVWGVDDASHEAIGTAFNPSKERKGNQPLEIFLASQLDPSPAIHFVLLEYEGHQVVLLRIPRATHSPVSFSRTRYIRVGESVTELRKHPNVERALWTAFEQTPVDLQIAIDHVDEDQILSLLDYPSYFDLTSQQLPDNRAGILERLVSDQLVVSETGRFAITSLAALLFAKSLTSFDRLRRKAVRVVVYSSEDRSEIGRQQVGEKGYASGFEGLISFVTSQLPENVHIGEALRTTVPLYPALALREIIANALIHQDLHVAGAGPMIEIFPSRIEITNPGDPLVPIDRFLDHPPRSRNEALASLMRRMGICEESGSGIDRALTQIEFFQLPPLLFEVVDSNTRITLFAPRPFSDMSKEERIRAAYQHAGLRYVMNQRMTNPSLRERFGIDDQKFSTIVSNVIADAIEGGLIRRDPPGDTSRRHAKYVPIWA